MFKKINNLLCVNITNPNKLIIIVFSLMFTLVILKMISIFLLTMRGVGLGWPFNSYLFDPFHRFTDWLIPWAWAHSSNPWDVDGELIKKMPASPYGPLTFYYMRLTAFMGVLTSFFVLILYYIFVLYKIVEFYYKDKYGVLVVYLIVVALIVVCYPLHFIVDRGNADIFAGAIIVHLIYYIISSKNIDKNLIMIATVAIVGSKPTWIPFAGLLLLPFNFKYLIKGIFLIVLVYLSPILFYEF